MKGTVKLWCGIGLMVFVICSSAIAAYAMGNASAAGIEVVNTGKAVFCAAVAMAAGVLTVLKRHVWKRQ